ncbi:MAG: LysM peptidoglycan-binding domain-containing protein [Pseudomonadota bacterium]
MIRLVLVCLLVIGGAVGMFVLTEARRPLGTETASSGWSDLVARARLTDPASPAFPGQSAEPQAEMARLTANAVSSIARATGAASVSAGATVPSELDALTRAVLAGLGAPSEVTAPKPGNRTLSEIVDQAMRASESEVALGQALAAPTLATAPVAPPSTGTPPSADDLSVLIERALSDTGSDSYLDQVLNDAADAGYIAVPAALRTPDGRLDTRTLLADIVQKSSGTPTPVRAPSAASAGGVAGVEVRVVQTATETTDALFYTVQPGDSLGAIARRFYGNASLYQSIFEANRRILSTPDRIRVGQRLILPDLRT